MIVHIKVQVHTKCLTIQVCWKKPQDLWGWYPFGCNRNHLPLIWKIKIILITLAKNFFVSWRTRSEIKKNRKWGCTPPINPSPIKGSHEEHLMWTIQKPGLQLIWYYIRLHAFFLYKKVVYEKVVRGRFLKSNPVSKDRNIPS